jgi:hypothetical protein
MERQYVEMKKINWGMMVLVFILWILAIGCYISKGERETPRHSWVG